jgi:hypothetical protein
MQTSLSLSVGRAFLGCQIEKVVDELNLSKKIHLLPPIELAPSGSCGLLRSLESFAEPPEILGSPAWRLLDV